MKTEKNENARKGNIQIQLVPHYHNSAAQLESAETLDLPSVNAKYFFPFQNYSKGKKKSSLIKTKDIKTGLDLFPHSTKPVVNVQGQGSCTHF